MLRLEEKVEEKMEEKSERKKWLRQEMRKVVGPAICGVCLSVRTWTLVAATLSIRRQMASINNISNISISISNITL